VVGWLFVFVLFSGSRSRYLCSLLHAFYLILSAPIIGGHLHIRGLPMLGSATVHDIVENV